MSEYEFVIRQFGEYILEQLFLEGGTFPLSAPPPLDPPLVLQ